MKNILKLLLVFATIAAAVGCNQEEYPEYKYQTRIVKLAFLNSEITVYEGKEVEIQGIGFNLGDKIIFRSAETDYIAEIVTVEDSSGIFHAPAMPEGTYTLYISREDKIQKVSTITVWLTLDLDVPEKDGYSLRGIVHCGKDGIPGVWVSDGINFAQTDEQGFYWLESDKRFGYVFVCLPFGYLPATGSNAVPGYWKSVSIDANLNEQCNFELKEADTSSHQVFFATDLHLANRKATGNTTDLQHFDRGFIADAKALATEYGSNSFVVTMGDITWDAHWYSTGYMPDRFVSTMKNFTLPMFNCMGNHDNNPYVQGDDAGSKIYRSTVAPCYYSFNLGEVHYIILDNIMWKNTNGANGFVGERDYAERIDDVQLEWLKKDLSHIADKSKPVVVCAHSQFCMNNNNKFENRTYLEGCKAALDCFNGFTNVHLMTGHAHYNMTMQLRSNIIEHNVAAVCETWWKSAWYSSLSDGRGINRDGTPAGFAVFEFKGNDLKWYYKSIGFDRTKQFHSFDMNKVKAWFNSNALMLGMFHPTRGNGGDDYKDVEENAVYINVWDYDPQWNISVTENGKALNVTRVFDRDPLHTITTDYPIAMATGDLIDSEASTPTAHMFKVVASSKTSTLEIKVTNRFGEEFTETMTRPKEYKTTVYIPTK